MERAAPAPIAATCLSTVLRETLPREGLGLGPDDIWGAVQFSHGSGIKMSFHFWAQETVERGAPVAEIRSPGLATRPQAGASIFFQGVPRPRLAVRALGFFAIK